MLLFCYILSMYLLKLKNSIITVQLINSHVLACMCVKTHTHICSGKALSCAQEMLLNLKKKTNKTSSVFCWLFASTKVKAALDLGQSKYDLYCYKSGQHSSKCLQKQEFPFTTRLMEIRRLYWLRWDLFLNL